MPRGPRLDAPGVLHHVMARGLDRQTIFRDDRDRDDFVHRLADLAQTRALVVYAWALLPNHFHLLVRTGNKPLSRAMRSLLTGYAGAFNRRHRRSGHLFQNRYKSIVVEEAPYFLELVRYLHLNPVRSGVVTNFRELDRYPYSGHAALVGAVSYGWQDADAVLREFGSGLRLARVKYRTFLADGVGRGRRPEFIGGGLVRSAGGWAAVRDLRRGREGYASDERILGSSEFVEGLLREKEQEEARRARAGWQKMDLATLVKKVTRTSRITPGALLGGGRRREISHVRDGLAYLWIEILGRSGRRLAQELMVRPESIYRAAQRGKKEQRRWRSALGL